MPGGCLIAAGIYSSTKKNSIRNFVIVNDVLLVMMITNTIKLHHSKLNFKKSSTFFCVNFVKGANFYATICE